MPVRRCSFNGRRSVSASVSFCSLHLSTAVEPAVAWDDLVLVRHQLVSNRHPDPGRRPVLRYHLEPADRLGAVVFLVSERDPDPGHRPALRYHLDPADRPGAVVFLVSERHPDPGHRPALRYPLDPADRPGAVVFLVSTPPSDPGHRPVLRYHHDLLAFRLL